MVIFVKKVLLFFFVSLSISAADLMPFFTYKSNVWTKTKEQIKTEIMTPSKFKWVEESVSANAFRTASFGDVESYETIINFDGYNLSRFTFSLYNRGDAAQIFGRDFLELKSKVSKMVQKLAGRVKPKVDKRKIKHTYTETTRWDSRFSTFLLSAARSKKQKINGITIPERYEYLKLTIVPRKKSESKKSTNSKVNPKEKIVRKRTGEVELVGIPMIDQGQKGYCAVATVERVMRFYNLDVDQHQLAQLANSTASGGTSLELMHDILKKVGVKLRIKIKSLIEFDMRDIEKIARNYNKVAKKNDGVELGDLRSYYSYRDLYFVFKENRDDFVQSMQKHSDFKKFRREIQKNILEGKPLLWCCYLGVIKEGDMPQMMGAHMRLIQGYNFSKKGEETIIYSDSWGQKHERKVMKLEDAWAMTFAISVITAR